MHDRASASIASLNRMAADPGDESVQFRPAELEQQLAPVLAVDVQKVATPKRKAGVNGTPA